ncbi:MAG: hypothetical protein QOJ99_4306 [Bryobacterales bacterium]|jgi:hypothetical protein|nr:hypothetical protein [Bryobacterales bacterium]
MFFPAKGSMLFQIPSAFSNPDRQLVRVAQSYVVAELVTPAGYVAQQITCAQQRKPKYRIAITYIAHRGRARLEQELSKLCAGGSGCVDLCRNQHQPVHGGLSPGSSLLR